MDAPVELCLVLESRTCLVGLGDGSNGQPEVGLFLIDNLRSSLTEGRAILIRAEDDPERYVFEIADSGVEGVVFIDGIEACAEPGTVFFWRIRDSLDLLGSLSQHSLSLQSCGEILEGREKPAYLLGIVVDGRGNGLRFSQAVKESAEELARSILTALE